MTNVKVHLQIIHPVKQVNMDYNDLKFKIFAYELFKQIEFHKLKSHHKL